MTDKYWVGGTGTWDGVDKTHWSLTSGGSGGADPPGNTDTVWFNSASNLGSYSVNVTASPSIVDFYISNPPLGTLSFTFGSLQVQANMILGTGVSFSGTTLHLSGSSGSGNISLNPSLGATNVVFGFFGGAPSSRFLNTALVTTGNVEVRTGYSITKGAYNIDCGTFTLQNGATITSSGGRLLATGDMTISGSLNTSSTSLYCYKRLIVNGIGISGAPDVYLLDTLNSSLSIQASDVTFGTVTLSSASAGTTYSFNSSGGLQLTVTTLVGSGNTQKTLSASGTYTVGAFSVDGSAGARLTMNGGTWVKSGGGTVTVDFADISNTTVSPSNTWYAGDGTSVATSTGWVLPNVGFAIAFGSNF